MQSKKFVYNLLIILAIIFLPIATYTTILLNNFKTPDSANIFFRNSNAYYYLAEIIKSNIRINYPEQLNSNIIKFVAANTILNNLITTDTIEQIALPVLRARYQLGQIPIFLAEENVKIETAQYTQQLSQTLTSLQLPPALNDASQDLVSAVPSEIVLVDTKERPNSILAAIANTKALFTNIQAASSLSWMILAIITIGLLYFNFRQIQKFTRGLAWVFAVTAILMLIASLTVPAIASTSSTPNAVSGLLRDAMVSSMVSYFFLQTSGIIFIYLLISLALIIAYRLLPWSKIQQWINENYSSSRK